VEELGEVKLVKYTLQRGCFSVNNLKLLVVENNKTGFMTAEYHLYLVLAVPANHPHLF